MTREKRTERFGLVLTPPEREGLRYLADLEGLAEADVLRRLLRMAINDAPAGAQAGHAVALDLCSQRRAATTCARTALNAVMH